MQKIRLLAAAATAALASLSACNKPEVLTVNQYDPQAEALRNAAPVTAPPPMIQATRAYRCPDNSLFFVDFYTNATATIRTSHNGAATPLAGTNGAAPFTGAGYSVGANGDRTAISAPGKGSQSCHV